MQICLNCRRGIKDGLTQCSKCLTSDLMNKQEFNKLFDLYSRASHKKRQELLYSDDRYKLIIKYCFPNDNNIKPHKPRTTIISWLKKQAYLSQINTIQIDTNNLHQTKNNITIQSSNTPRCPTCNSTNVQKISVAQKATGFALVGIFSSNFGKTMQCKNCGYKF